MVIVAVDGENESMEPSLIGQFSHGRRVNVAESERVWLVGADMRWAQTRPIDKSDSRSLYSRVASHRLLEKWMISGRPVQTVWKAPKYLQSTSSVLVWLSTAASTNLVSWQTETFLSVGFLVTLCWSKAVYLSTNWLLDWLIDWPTE